MKKILLAGLLLISGYTVSAQAVTHYRWPIDYFSTTPNEVSRWHDHTAQCGYLCRYDGVVNPGATGHPGTDIRWNGTRTVVRMAAHGDIYFRKDGCGNYDNQAGCPGYGNHVRVRHADGKVSISAHLEKWSVSPIVSALCGYQVGIMGNSGTSTATHLHFELWANQSIGQRIDPFGGAYSNNGLVYWVSQNENGYGKPSFRCE